MSLKPLTKVAVLTAAVDLMLSNSQTTNLDVKERLRKEGYNAKQTDVSDHMRQLKNEEAWTSSDSGAGYQIYYPASSGAGMTSSPVTTPSASVSPVGKVIGAWEVNSVSGTGILYFAGSNTRSAARWAFAVANKVQYVDTRARKVK
jgi:hypothetical protein